MKILADFSYTAGHDNPPKVGINWYRHYKGYPYKGLNVELFFFKWWIVITYVNDYKAYQAHCNKRRASWERFKRKLSD